MLLVIHATIAGCNQQPPSNQPGGGDTTTTEGAGDPIVEPAPTGPYTPADPAPIDAVPAERLQPTDFTYQGAFRLPDDFNWGARGLSFYPNGAGGAGSLLVTGFELL